MNGPRDGGKTPPPALSAHVFGASPVVPITQTLAEVGAGVCDEIVKAVMSQSM
eukprot:CAMPEP_0113869808 /NCGR_PEP_ID=MMETSP0780_2-20120614/1741_1 /TAXON_ID=652834 /ORGANISM="Palpitomonas bilix" /LENGTH=52 /DNA_ID=CAMNT_0000855025 /DNA_START=1 /DNA_END=159 /DNA_ORIENTATION=- /assembly_acc=CAM_ASM_000599